MTKTQTFFLTTIFAALIATAAAAQPIGPGPIGGGPIGPGPMGLGPIGPGPGAHAMRLGRPVFDADDRDDKADDLYSDGRDAIEEGRYERALDRFNRLIDLKSNRTDAALYWKAYSQYKLGRRADALSTLADMQQQFKDSRWLKEARALEVEVRQASGQTVAPENQVDDETKLLALRGLMNSDPDRAIQIIEQLLAGPNSPRVKDRALIVLSQSGSSRARDI